MTLQTMQTAAKYHLVSCSSGLFSSLSSYRLMDGEFALKITSLVQGQFVSALQPPRLVFE